MSSSKDKVVDIHDDSAALKKAVRAEMKRRDLSQTAAAREAGLGPASLSHWLNDSYRGDNEKLAGKLVQWLEACRERVRAQADLPKAPDFVDTPTTKRIHAALVYAQGAGDVAVVYGGAGVSKTQTLRHYAETHPNAWLAQMTPACSGVGSAMVTIADALEVGDMSYAPAKMQRELIARMRGTQGVILVDEAQNLSVQALEQVRSLHDIAEVGLVLAGNEQVYARLTGGARSAHFAQLFSRIGKRVRLVRPTQGDVKAIAQAWKLNTDNGAMQVCQQIAAKPGGLRGLTKSLRLASMYAAGRKEDRVTSDLILAAWRELGGDDGSGRAHA